MSVIHGRIVLAVFALTLFLSASLLFWIQPLLAKMVLPYLGGSPSVWNTCMMFFQGVLLIGYLYAHFLTRLPTKIQLILHISLLALGIIFLPFVISPNGLSVNQTPVLALMTLLIYCASIPLIAISASAPLLQRWFASTLHPEANDPYFLYGASNAGSLVALLAFPFILEPRYTLTLQSHLWEILFLVLILLIILCGLTKVSAKSKNESIASDQLSNNTSLSRKLYWLALSFVPSSLLLGVTTYITTDIAALPLFWVFPLSLYLLTFILAFARKPIIQQSTAQIVRLSLILPFFIVMIHPSYIGHFTYKLAIHLVLFFTTAYVCHSELVKYRPSHERLTSFYLWIALGGFLGGVFNTLLAPLMFSDTSEYPVVLMLSLLLVPPEFFNKKIIVTVVALFFISSYYFASPDLKYSILTTRNFFGTLHVVEFPKNVHHLFHGTTLHGLQVRDAGRQKDILSYYTVLVKIFNNLHLDKKPLNVAITGLGTGSCACLARSDDEITFYEINPGVVKIAEDPQYFSFLKLCPPKGGIVLGDARLNLQKTSDKLYDVMVLDAFSSDSIPVHLLTSQALELYFNKLKEDGILIINISNRYLDVTKVLSALAMKYQLASAVIYTGNDYNNFIYQASWVILTKNNVKLEGIISGLKVKQLPLVDPSYLWTDDYSDIIRLLR
jgi:spermidine synthase